MVVMNFSQLNFGGFAIKIYGVLLAIAFFVAAWQYYKRVQKMNFDVDFFVHHFGRWLVGGILLGRLFAVLQSPEIWETYGVFSFFAFWEGTLDFLGVIIGFVLALLLDFRIQKKNVLRWLDIAILPTYIGIIITDVAGFLTGAIYGKETELFWGVRYETFGVESINSVHPITLYALLIHCWIYFWIRSREPRWLNFPGRLAAWGGFLFVATDFLIQFMRADQTIYVGILRISQIFEILLMIVLWWYVKRFHRTKKKT